MSASSDAVSMSGPLKRYADGFEAAVAAQGYAAKTVMFHRQVLGYLSRWLETYLTDREVDALLAAPTKRPGPGGVTMRCSPSPSRPACARRN